MNMISSCWKRLLREDEKKEWKFDNYYELIVSYASFIHVPGYDVGFLVVARLTSTCKLIDYK